MRPGVSCPILMNPSRLSQDCEKKLVETSFDGSEMEMGYETFGVWQMVNGENFSLACRSLVRRPAAPYLCSFPALPPSNPLSSLVWVILVTFFYDPGFGRVVVYRIRCLVVTCQQCGLWVWRPCCRVDVSLLGSAIF